MQPNRIKKYIYNDEIKHRVFKKNNFFVGIEEHRSDIVPPSVTLSKVKKTNEKITLSSMEMMILQTAFLMCDQLNQTKKANETYDSETDFIISLKQFAELWGIGSRGSKLEDGSFYTTVRRAIYKLDRRRFLYNTFNSENGKEAKVLSGYFASVKFFSSKEKGSEFAFSFPKEFIPYLKSYGKYTWYYFENTIKLQDYPNAIVLYEQFSRLKNHPRYKKSPTSITVQIEIDKLRKILGVTEKYNNTDAIRKIIKPAIDKINSESSIHVASIDNIRNGKNIVGVEFNVEFSETDLNFENAIKIANEGTPFLTENQIYKYSTILSQDEDFRNFLADERLLEGGNIQLAYQLSNDLRDNMKVMKYYSFLRKCGFTSKRVDSLSRINSED